MNYDANINLLKMTVIYVGDLFSLISYVFPVLIYKLTVKI